MDAHYIGYKEPSLTSRMYLKYPIFDMTSIMNGSLLCSMIIDNLSLNKKPLAFIMIHSYNSERIYAVFTEARSPFIDQETYEVHLFA